MIKHVVVYRLKDFNDAAETKRILETMRGKIPYIVNMEVGIDFLRSPRSYDILLSSVFESREKMDLYQAHPYHVDVVKKHMHSVIESAASVDFEF